MDGPLHKKGILGGKVLGFNMFNHDTFDSYDVKLWLTRRYVQSTKSRGGFPKVFMLTESQMKTG